MKVEINLNDRIKVKLTGKGVDYLVCQRNKLSSVKITADYYKHSIDKDGYFCTQMWDFFGAFGELMLFPRMDIHLYFDPNIIVE